MTLDNQATSAQDSPRMLARVRNFWAARRQASPRENLYFIAVGLVLMLGVFLRVHGWLADKSSFWLDEALWGSRLLHQPLLSLGIRPVGYMWLSREIVELFGAREVWFRLLPALAGVASLLLMPYVASRLLSRLWLRFVLLLLFAIHPALIDYCNEFKPYSWEVLIHLVPVVLYLRYRQTQRSGWFFGLLAFLPIGFLLAYNLALAFPGLLLACAWIAWRSPQRKHWLAATLVSGALCAGAGATIFALSLKTVTKEERTESYWGKKYDVFYEKTEQQPRVEWTVQKLNDLAAFVNLRRIRWADGGTISERAAGELGAVDRLFWMGLSYVGLWALWRKQRDLLLVLLAPLVVMVLGNLAGKWPLGVFRTNIFALVYLFPLPFLGTELLATSRGRTIALATLTTCLALVPAFAFGFDWSGRKHTFTRDFYAREVIAELHAQRKAQLARDPELPKARVYLDLHSAVPLQFYLLDHPDYRQRYGKFFKENFILDKTSAANQKKQLQQKVRREHARQGFFIVSSSRREADNVESAVDKSPNKTALKVIGDEHLVISVEPRPD